MKLLYSYSKMIIEYLTRESHVMADEFRRMLKEVMILL